MEGSSSVPRSIDEYISGFSPQIQAVLQEIRSLIKAAAPHAQEKISWAMPTFYYHGNLVHFAANKSHLGFYPGAEGVEHFRPELGEYKTSKGAIQFPYAKPLPKDLISRIVTFRAAQNEAWAMEKKK